MDDSIKNRYRTADHERWKNEGYILGIEVHRSPTSKDEKCKICENMAGIYPKSFNFQGWHEGCICIIVPHMLEGQDFTDYLISGEVPQDKIIKTIPDKSRRYLIDNYEQMKVYPYTDKLLNIEK